LALLALVMLAFTLPAYLDTSNNPGLANLTGEAASLGSVAGAFLAAQSGGIRPLIPTASGHRFRFDSATDSGAFGHP